MGQQRGRLAAALLLIAAISAIAGKSSQYVYVLSSLSSHGFMPCAAFTPTPDTATQHA